MRTTNSTTDTARTAAQYRIFNPIRRIRSAYGSTLSTNPSFLPALAATGVFIWFAAEEAGFRSTTWYPGGLIILGLLVVSLVALPRPQPSRTTLAAVLLLAAFATWSLLSVTWAPDKGTAWMGGDRTVLYAGTFALFALWPMQGRAAQLLLGLFGGAIAAIALVVLLRARAAADPAQFFFEARFDEPAGYVNANVALWFLGFWPCAIFSARRETPPLLRGLFLGGTSLLIGVGLMGQSRGWLFALPAIALLAVVIGPNRGRFLVLLLALAAATAVMARPVLNLFDRYQPGDDLSTPLADASGAILVVSALLALAGVLAGMVELHVPVRPPVDKALEKAAVGIAIALALVGLAVFTVSEGNPVAKASDYWADFKHGESTTADQPARRLTGPPSTRRYDFWQVGVALFAERPLIGYGADNFQQQYLIRGTSRQQPRYPHSLEVRTLQQTGIVGAFLLSTALILAFVMAGRGLKGRRDSTAAVAASGILAAAYWIVHGSVDWLWEFPGLSCPALAMLGLGAAAADWSRQDGAASQPGRAPGLRLAQAGAVFACLGALLSVALPWLSELEVRKAGQTWRSDPSAAFERLDRAGALNPLSDLPKLSAGTIAIQIGDLRRAEVEFRAALERDGGNSYAYLQLGAIASERGNAPEALRSLRRAVALNPRDAPTLGALRRARRGKRLDAAGLGTQLLRESRLRIGGG